MESFHSYPRNLGGIALLLLRSSVGLLLLSCVHAECPNEAPRTLSIAAMIMCVGLALGILTPFVSGSALLGGIALLASEPAYISIATIATLLLCATISILGGGAYSLDAALFGRRRIIL